MPAFSLVVEQARMPVFQLGLALGRLNFAVPVPQSLLFSVYFRFPCYYLFSIVTSASGYLALMVSASASASSLVLPSHDQIISWFLLNAIVIS